METVTSSKVVTVTPEEARHLRQTCHFEKQRKMSAQNVERLRLLMVAGRFLQGTPVTLCALPDGRAFIVNGNHTLEAIAESGLAQLLTLVVMPVPDMAAVARVYNSLDVHKQRTWVDALHAEGLDADYPLAREVMAALGLVLQDFRYSSENIEANTSRDLRFGLMPEYRRAATLAHDALAGAPTQNRRLCLRRAVLGIALETFRHQSAAATEFWHALSHDDGLTNGDPRKTLLRYLLANKITGPIENFRQARACALAWNAWYRGESLVLLKPGSGDTLVLYGTPLGTTKFFRELKPATATDDTGARSDGATLADLFQTGQQVGPDGAKPATYYKH